MNYRHEGVRKNQDATYQWLMTHPQWLAWIDQARAVEHHGLLWIKGKPGAGKSTIMNFAYSQATKNKTITAISFFFNAQGDILERSVIGMCRSLLFQLINALPTLDLLKVQRYKDELDDLYSVQHPEWGLGLLQDMLQTAVDRLGEQRLMLLIDALDECNEEEVEAMVEYFKNLGKHAMQDGKLLRICFSSRHYPHIDIQNGLVLDLESQQGHCNDITTYIESRLKIGERKTSQGIKRWLYERSKGIFMWVVLVVTILNRALDRGQIHEITYRLDEIPTGLSSLFKNILGRGQNDIREFRLCIQWIYFAQRPLEIQEYYFAVVSGLRPDRLSKWDRKEITEEDMKKFVLSSSRGFAEIINHPYQGSTVHFIHESVREFFLKDGFSVLWPNTSKLDFERAGHHEIQECCDNYLKFATANWKFSIAWVDDDDTDRVHNLKRSVPPKFPFLEYATQNILYHTNATSERRSQKALLEDFLLKSWINYHNIFATHLNHLYKSSASLLYILADNNYVELISVALEMDPRFDIRGERHVYPLFAALINGHRDAFNALLQEGTEGPKEDIFGKLTNKSRNLLYQLNGGTPLLWATMEGHEQIVRLLVARGVDVNAKDSDGRTPLSWAAFNGCGQAVELLLAKGGDANAEDCTGRTPLSWAASKGHKQVVRLLSQMTMYTDARSVFQTSLLLAASEGHEDIVETLLRNIIDADVVSVGRTPLSMAAMEGHENIVRMLLDRGLDVQVKDICGQVPLSSASSQGHAGVVRLLLDRGADARAQDADGRTALDWARSEGHIKVEEILSLRGVDE